MFFSEVGKIGPFTIIGDPERKFRNLGLADNNRKIVIDPAMGYQSFIDYHDGLLIANKPTKTGPGWMVIDYFGNQISPVGEYTFVTYAEEGYYDIEKGSRHNIMRRDGTFVLEEWPHRVSSVHNGYFSFGNTIRKTKTTPTRYVDGLAHVSGLIVFPMIFEGLHHEGDSYFRGKINNELMYAVEGAVYDPSKKHYPQPEAENKYGKLIEETINWVLPGLQFFYRDTDAVSDAISMYPVGAVFRSGFYVDMSTRLFKPNKKTRFIVAAAHAALLCDEENPELPDYTKKYSPKATEWCHAVLHKNTWLKVMDVYQVGDVTQVLLLQIPETAAKLFGNSDAVFKFIDGAMGDETSLVELARQSLDEKIKDMVHPRSLDQEFSVRMAQPIGYDSNGTKFPLEPDLTPYSQTGPEGSFSFFIHRIANDKDIKREIDGFPWRGIVGTVCEGCMYAKDTNDKPFGCGRLFEKEFRTNYTKGLCEYHKESLEKDSMFEYGERKQREVESKKAGTYAERLLQEFIDEKLGGNIDSISDFDFRTLKGDPKFGGLKGPDMVSNFAIVKSIMEIVFGEYWPELNVDSLDVYTYQTGTIINDGRLVGIRLERGNFKTLNRFSDNRELVDMAEDLHTLKGTIGNFIVWPNKAVMHSIHDSSKLRGYIDRTFIGMYEVASGAKKPNVDVAAAMYKNRKLMKDYQGVDGFHKFMDVSLLEDFLDENGVPKRLFDGISNSAKDFNPDLLPAAVKQYHDFMAPFVRQRSARIIEILKSNGF